MSRISLGYGLVTCQRHPDHDEGWTPLYAEALELAATAEEVGLDSIWVSEHHFVDDGHLPSLLVLLGAMAARTRVTLGTALLLAPSTNRSAWSRTRRGRPDQRAGWSLAPARMARRGVRASASLSAAGRRTRVRRDRSAAWRGACARA
jgi:hypothetical protein